MSSPKTFVVVTNEELAKQLRRKLFPELAITSELFVEIQGQEKRRVMLIQNGKMSAAIQKEEMARAGALLRRIECFEQDQASRVAVFRGKMRDAKEFISSAERVKEKEEHVEKARILKLGERIKAPNPAIDWERDTNSTASDEQSDGDPMVDDAKDIVVECDQRLDYETMLCVGLEWAMASFASTGQMDAAEARDWMRGTAHSQKLQSECTDLHALSERTTAWMDMEVAKALKQKEDDAWMAAQTCVQCGKIGCGNFCFGADRSEDGELPNKCNHCGKDGHRENECWVLHPDLLRGWVGKGCTHCGKRFHEKENCFQLHQEKRLQYQRTKGLKLRYRFGFEYLG